MKNTIVSISGDGKKITVDGIMIDDDDIIDMLSSIDSSKRADVVNTALRFGLLSMRDLNTVSKIDWVDKKITSFKYDLERITDDIHSDIESYVGDGGIIEKSFTDIDSPIRIMFDPSNEKSPLYSIMTLIEKTVKELRDDVVGKIASDEELKKGTRKGMKFEEMLFEYLSPICAKYGDKIHLIGTKSDAGRKTGDILIDIKDKHMKNNRKIVIEAKSGKISVYAQDGLVEQMDRAIELRNADYAIGIVKEQENIVGGDGCFMSIHPDKIICSFDDTGLPLELAYRVARNEIIASLVNREVSKSSCADIMKHIEDVKSKIKEMSNIKSHLTNIDKSSGTIRESVENIQSDIKNTLRDIERILSTK